MIRDCSGLTLMELLACLAIAGVLAAAALPLHREAMLRARRADARDALLALQALQERYYFAHGRYAHGLEQLGAPARRRSPQGLYQLEVWAQRAGQGFIASASPLRDGPQARDATCQELTLDDTGRRGARGVGDARRCWG